MLESYIAPLFMGYVDKYIKNLKPSDLSLSLWGGDAILHNLELNLEVLQQELNLPVKFLSGKIHKLQIHVPWTSLMYDPVVITIDTVKFVVKLKDASDVGEKKEDNQRSEDLEQEIQSAKSHETEQLPPGYVQSILNKVINNVEFKVNNIIIKYVEDDIVFSLNVKSVDFHSSDENWQKAFIHLTLPELLLRKVCNITDLTICLDQQNSSGRIELYQDPVLYKCNLSCRILSRYKGLSSLKPHDNLVNIYCECSDFSLTDLQIPMVMRLIKLIIGLFYGTLDLPGCNIKHHTAPKIIEDHKKEKTRMSTSLFDDSTQADTSWSSWAWSMVPGYEDNEKKNQTKMKEDIKTTVGIYVAQTNVTFKATNYLSDYIIASQRLEFSPVFSLEFSGCVMELVSIGNTVIDVNVGVQSIVGYTVGKQCICAIGKMVAQKDDSFDEEVQSEDTIFLKIGLKSGDVPPHSFLKYSLFHTNIGDNQDQESDTIENIESPLGTSEEIELPTATYEEKSVPKSYLDCGNTSTKYKPGTYLSETEINKRYGSVFMNYFYEMSYPEVMMGEIENIFLYPETDEVVPEVSEKRIHLSNCKLFVTTKFFHSMEWLYDAISVNTPSRKEKSGIFLDPFVLQQLSLGNLLSRKLIITCSDSEMYILTTDHDKKKSSHCSFLEEKEALFMQLGKFSMTKVDPMYPTELISMVEKGKLVKLNKIKNLNSTISLSIEDFQVGISLINQETLLAFTLFMMQPTNSSLQINLSLLSETFQTHQSSPIINANYEFECSEMSLMFTKVHVMLLYEIMNSWISPSIPQAFPSLVNAAFYPSGSSSKYAPLMNVDIREMKCRYFDMKDIQGISGSLGSMNATLQSVGSDGHVKTSVLFNAPSKTESLPNINEWLSDLVENNTSTYIHFTLQYQKESCEASDTMIQLASVNIAGATVNFDVLLFAWLSHQVNYQARRRIQSGRRQGSIMNQSISSTTPKRKSYARVFGSNTSPSQHSKEKDQKVYKDENLLDEKLYQKEERFGEWMARKINVFKSFHLNLSIEPIVMIFPEKQWPDGYESVDHISMMRSVYLFQNHDFPSTLIFCLPKITINSFNQNKEVFRQDIPVISKQKRRKIETLPWTLTCENLAIYTLFANTKPMDTDRKVELTYLCKPMSWNLYLASANPTKLSSRISSSLSIIKEGEDHLINIAPKHVTCTAPIQDKQRSGEHKMNIGYVLHIDWSVCEFCISHKQLKLASTIIFKLYSISQTLTFRSSEVNPPLLSHVKHQNNTAKDTSKTDAHSVSSTSTVDQVDAFSTLTGSTSMFPKSKVGQSDICISLWIQCTMPKVKCAILSEVKDSESIYQVISEIEEIMFAFDYQDNILELTNKIGSCVVYYSLLRFDQDPVGWVTIKDGYLLCQKEKFHESSYLDSKTLFSIVYRRTHHLSQSISSPDQTVSGHQKKTSDKDTAGLMSSTSFQIHDDYIIKHEVTIHMLSFDLIGDSKPILSSVGIFMNLAPGSEIQSIVKPKSRPKEGASTVMTLPLLTLHCDSVRVIIPVGDDSQTTNLSSNEPLESVFVCHFQSVDLKPSPSNPITKTITDKVLYRHAMMNYRDALKRLKLWNVQYQLDVMNIGICTTNWQTLESSLPSKYKQVQNPALEWNSQSWHSQQMMSPMFPGFDFKATVAPPIMLQNAVQVHPVTAAAFEFHSPREVKLYVSSNQISLAVQVMHDFNSLIEDITTLFNTAKQGLSVTETINDNTDSGVVTSVVRKKNSPPKFVVPAIEMFASVSSISLTLYHKKIAKLSKSSIYPALLIDLMQPTCTVTSFKENNLQFNLYDVSVRTSSNVNGIHGDVVVPMPVDFDTNILTCGKGRFDETTGLIPGTLKLKVSLMNDSSICVKLAIERPINLTMLAKATTNMQSFMSELFNTFVKPNSMEVRKGDTGATSDENTSQNEEKLSYKLVNISVSTQRVCLSASPSCQEATTYLIIQYEELEGNTVMQYSKKKHQLESIYFSSKIDGFRMFCENTEHTNVLMPFNFALNILAEFCQHSGNKLEKSFYPRMLMWYHGGFTEVHICQHLISTLSTLANEVVSVMQSDNVNKSCEVENEISKDTKVETSEDDLRNGQFEYVLQEVSTNSLLEPDDFQIVFTNERDCSPMMTWKYPEARMIKDIQILPVPFCVSNVTRQNWIEDTETIPCLLEYWDEISHSFVPCERLFLSENDTSHVTITKDLSKGMLSRIWRVLVMIPEEIKSNANEKSVIMDSSTPVPATSLAACMKVNSLYSPALVPSLEVCCSVESLNIIISNSMLSSGSKSPAHFSPYFLEEKEAHPDIIEAVSITLEGVEVDANILNNKQTILNMGSKMEMSVMDFNNFCWIKVLRPTEISIGVEKPLTMKDWSSVKLDVNIGKTDILVSQTAVHTLTLTSNAWLNMFHTDAEITIYNHYVLCNETHDTIHLQQVNTDEDITLRSGQLYPYSWCSVKQEMLHFCLESVGDWKWSEPIDINELGIFPRKIEHNGFSSQLFVEIKRTAGLQKQIIFHGSCTFVNHLNFDISMEVVTQETDHSSPHIQQSITNVSQQFTLFDGVSRPSLTISTSFMKSIKVAMCEVDGSECGKGVEMHFLQSHEESHRCIQLHDGSKSYNCWLSFHYSSRILGHLIVTLSPLFVFRNHLAEPALIKVEEKNHVALQFDVLVNGRGKEVQVFKLDEDKWYDVSFCLVGSKEKSKPPFTLNTSQSKLLSQESISSALGADTWPYIEAWDKDVTVCSMSQKVSYKTQASITNQKIQDVAAKKWQEAELVLQSGLKWPHLPTICVDLKPRILICNLTKDILQIRSLESGYVDIIEGKSVVSTLHVQKKFLLGLKLDGVTYWSQTVTLDIGSAEPESPSLNENLKPGTTSHCSVLVRRKKLCYQYAFTCEENEGIVTICIKNRFMLHNLSASVLIMVPLLLEGMSNSLTLEVVSAFTLKPESSCPTSMLNIEKSEVSNIPPLLVMDFDLKESVIGFSEDGVADVVSISNHVTNQNKSLHLSKDHLRESFNLITARNISSAFALTSCFDKGLIHVFIRNDTLPAIKIQNKTSVTLSLKEIDPKQLKQKKRFDVLSSPNDMLLIVNAESCTGYNPRSFTSIFPKTENKIEMVCQLAVYSKGAVELSKPIVFEKESNCSIFIPRHGEVFVKTSLRNSQLLVDICETNTSFSSVLKPLSIPMFELSLESLNIVVTDYQYPSHIESLLSASLGNLKVIHDINQYNSVFKITLGYFQIDNQLQDSCYHFPVIFLPMRQLSERYHSVTKDAPFPEVEACLDAAFCTLTFKANESIDSGTCIDNVHVIIQPSEMYLEDTFVYRLAAVVDSYIAPSSSSNAKKDTDDLNAVALPVLKPLCVCNVEVGELSLLLSVHASVKVFLAADHIPLVLGKFKCQPTQTVTKEFIRRMLYHYATQALVRVGWILGSFEIIGNPTGLIHNIGRGVADFFVLPYNGLIRGPTAFVSGIGHGMSSFLKHVSTGALTSINNVSSSISRNMDRLCFDEMHLLMQEERRAQTSKQMLTGFRNAFGSLGMSLLGAIAGIANHPIQNVIEANNSSEVISGVMSGMAKGMVGMVTKPIGGAMEFISQASQGILQGAGLVKIPERMILLLVNSIEDLARTESQMKFMWQYLHLESCRNIFVVSSCVIKSSQHGESIENVAANDGSSYRGVLILTETALFVYSIDTSNITSAFPLKEVELLPLECEDTYRLQICKRTQELHRSYQRSASLDENPNFRQFFESFRRASATSLSETMCENLSNAILEVDVKPMFGRLLLTLYKANKTLLSAESCFFDTVDL